MATRRPPRVRCGIVANVALAANVAFALGMQLFGCNAGGDPAGGHPPDGGALGGVGGTGSGGSTGSTISCNPTGTTGCLCIVDDPQPGQLTECSPTSVVQNEMERGVCCLAQSLCTCVRYTCRSNPASSFCQCGSVSTLAAGTLGTPAAECPAPTTGQKCCFSQDNASCTCSLLACAAEETEVPNCSADVAGACVSGEAITACR